MTGGRVSQSVNPDTLLAGRKKILVPVNLHSCAMHVRHAMAAARVSKAHVCWTYDDLPAYIMKPSEHLHDDGSEWSLSCSCLRWPKALVDKPVIPRPGQSICVIRNVSIIKVIVVC